MIQKKKLSVPFITLIIISIFSLPLLAVSEKQAPELRKAVKNGELKPLDQRLPENHLVFENEVGKIGKYGGTWNRVSDWEEFGYIRNAFYGHSILRWSKDGLEIEPNLATDWKQNQDATEWTFNFRKGVKWSDGEPFTVDDIIFWWRKIALEEEVPEAVPDWAKSGGEPMELEKIDDYTLKFKYAAPAPLLPERLAMWPTNTFGWIEKVVVPSHYLKKYHPDYSENGDYQKVYNHCEWWFKTDTPVLSAWEAVEYVAGEQVIYERNPYFYATDKNGNQLPYIDKIKVSYYSDKQIMKLKMSNGKSDFQIRPSLNVGDISMLSDKAEKNNFKVVRWDSGSGTGPNYFINYNHPDEQKRELYRNPEFLKSLSHAIDRKRINRMIFYNTGEPTTGTLSAKASEYHTDKGEELYKKWKNLAVEYNPEKTKKMLEGINLVDQDDDGWREFPNGEDLTLRIDIDAESEQFHMDTTELVKEDWRKVGLKTIVNPIDGSELGMMNTNATFDIHGGWGVSDGPNHLVYPQWLVPIQQDRWAPLHGNYYHTKGTAEAKEDADLPPRERSPKWKKPEEGEFVDTLQDLYDKAKIAPSEEKRNQLVYKMIKQHIEQGPVFIGTISNPPRVGIKRDKIKNVPTQEDLATGGFVGPWIMSVPAQYLPSTFYFDKK